MNQNHTLLKNTLFKYFPFLEFQEVEDFTKLWTLHKKVKRFDYLTNYGDVERNMYFVLSGTFRLYYPLDTEATVGFGLPNLFYNAYESFIKQEPSKVFLQALSKAEVIGITKECFDNFILSNWNFERAYRLNNEAMLLQRFEIDFLLKLPAGKRVQQFLDLNSAIFQLIPHKYIASYLNLTPETLSRILKSHNKS